VRDLEARGVVLSDLYADIERLLPPRAAEPTVSSPNDIDEVIDALVRAGKKGRGATAPAPRDVLRALLSSEHQGPRDVFARHGVKAEHPPPVRSRTRRVESPDTSDAGLGPYRAVPSDPERRGDTDVVFWNDAKTKMELVVQLLRDPFGMVEPNATMLMLTVHRDGFAIVGTYERSEAERLTTIALRRARDKGAPLEITVEEANRKDRARSLSRWLRRMTERTHVAVTPEQLRAARRRVPAPPPAPVDATAAVTCPHCGSLSKRHRKVEDALVCIACGRSFTQ